MSLRTKVATVLATLIVLSRAGFVAAAPAQAAVTDCGAGMCIWATSDYSAARYTWNPIPAANTCTPIGGVWDNVARSMRVVTPGKKVRLFTNSNCSGSFVTSILTGTFQATCLNTLHNWYTAASPCTGPTASSFYVYP